VTLKEVAETKGITDRQERLDLLKKRGKREITQSEMIMRGRSTKKGNPAIKTLIAVQDCPTTPLVVSTDGIKESPSAVLDTLVIPATPDGTETVSTQDALDNHSLRVSIEASEPKHIFVNITRQPGYIMVTVNPFPEEYEQNLITLEKELRAYITQQEKYELLQCEK